MVLPSSLDTAYILIPIVVFPVKSIEPAIISVLYEPIPGFITDIKSLTAEVAISVSSL